MAGVPDLVFSLVLGATLWVVVAAVTFADRRKLSRAEHTRATPPHALCEYVMRTGCLLAVVDTDEFRKLLDGSHAPAPFDDHFRSIVSTSSRDGLQCGPAMFPFSWFHHQSRLQANFAAQGAGTGSDRNRACRLTRSLLSLIIASPGIR